MEEAYWGRAGEAGQIVTKPMQDQTTGT